MPNLFRSEPMELVQLIIPTDTAQMCVSALGDLGLLQLKDLNSDVSAFQRNFVHEVKRYDEMERKMAFFLGQISQEDEYVDRNHLASESVEPMVELEGMFEEIERDLKENIHRLSALDRQQNEMREQIQVLQNAAPFLSNMTAGRRNPVSNLRPLQDENSLEDALLEEDKNSTEMEAVGSNKDINVGCITGVIAREKVNIFERVIFRAIRGNVYIRFADVTEQLIDPSTGQPQKKSVFIVFFSGKRSEAKITKVCDAFNANRYATPSDPEERGLRLEQIRKSMDDLAKIRMSSENQRSLILEKIAGGIDSWQTRIHKQKMTFHTLNMFTYNNQQKMLIGEGWAPKDSVELIQETILRASQSAGTDVRPIVHPLKAKKHDTPPTFFRANKYFAAFQNIVDAYGVARYREFNPAVFTMVTFPFLFAVMFGDVGHGILLTLAALWLVWKEREWKHIKLDDTVAMVYNGRFLLLLMGIFSIYCGTIYNDYFALGIDFVPHSNSDEHGMWRWKAPDADGSIEAEKLGGVYPWGIDPMWKGAKNMLPFLNSFKMKTSIIFGVVQMSMGIMVKLLNDVYFRDWVNVVFEWIPSILILQCTFGYLVIMIFVKWAIPWSLYASAPSLITMLINMFMSPLSIAKDEEFYQGQVGVQVFLLLIAGISVPMMLIPKPCIMWCMHKRKAPRRPPRLHNESIDDSNSVDGLMVEEGLVQPAAATAQPVIGADDDEEEDEFEFGEVFVHQTIHTIEFVLGTISNTASYLRLWALSLAHAELSEVFWDLTIAERGLGLELGPVPWWLIKPPAVFCTFAIWAAITFAVLMCMESLSAFLHALRLHWVEFQGKFYYGDGVPFVPLDFNKMDDDE